MNIYYVYVWYRADDDIPFYVGKGKGNRHLQIINRNRYFLNVYHKHGGYSKIIFNCLSESEAIQKEIETIKKYRCLYPLTNITNGGEGVSGMKHSVKTKQQLSQLAKKQWGNAETRKRLQNARAISEDKRRKAVSSAKQGTSLTEKHKAAIKAATNTKETRKKMSEARTKYRNIKCTKDGESIVFYNTRDAVDWLRSMGFNDASIKHILQCIHKLRQTAYGFCWEVVI